MLSDNCHSQINVAGHRVRLQICCTSSMMFANLHFFGLSLFTCRHSSTYVFNCALNVQVVCSRIQMKLSCFFGRYWLYQICHSTLGTGKCWRRRENEVEKQQWITGDERGKVDEKEQHKMRRLSTQKTMNREIQKVISSWSVRSISLRQTCHSSAFSCWLPCSACSWVPPPTCARAITSPNTAYTAMKTSKAKVEPPTKPG